MERRTILWSQMFGLTILLVGLPGPLWAGESTTQEEVVELGPLVHEALQHNPELVAIRAQVEAVRERVPQSRALEDPEFTIRLWNTPESLDLTRSERTIYGLGQRFPFPGTLSKQEQIAVKVAEQADQRR